MRVLVVGAGRSGARVLRQLHKNPNLTVLTLDPQEKPYAVREGIVAAIDICEALTPLTLDYVLAQAQPDLILLTTSTEDLGLGPAPGMDILVGALREELAAISEVPLIEVARASR
jgi:2-polyprenyl-6-methoxyphenol hydroxylase-like FAD-dependent oxidoreductase